MKNPIYDNKENSFIFNTVSEIDNDYVQVSYLDYSLGEKEPVETIEGETVEMHTISPKVFTKLAYLDRETSVEATSKIEEEQALKVFPGINVREQKLNMLRHKYADLLTRKGLNQLLMWGQSNFDKNLKNQWNASLVSTNKTIRRELIKVNFWPNPLRWFVNLFKKSYYEVTEETIDNNIHSIQRRMIAKILYASNFIAANGRFGPANVIVVNGRIGAMLQDSANFVYNSNNEVNRRMTGLELVGSIAGICVVIDFTKKWDDTSILVHRVGKATEPGLYMAYKKNFGENGSGLDVIEITDQEGSKTIVRGCQAIFEVGFKPELQTLLIPIDLPDFCN